MYVEYILRDFIRPWYFAGTLYYNYSFSFKSELLLIFILISVTSDDIVIFDITTVIGNAFGMLINRGRLGLNPITFVFDKSFHVLNRMLWWVFFRLVFIVYLFVDDSTMHLVYTKRRVIEWWREINPDEPPARPKALFYLNAWSLKNLENQTASTGCFTCSLSGMNVWAVISTRARQKRFRKKISSIQTESERVRRSTFSICPIIWLRYCSSRRMTSTVEWCDIWSRNCSPTPCCFLCTVYSLLTQWVYGYPMD